MCNSLISVANYFTSGKFLFPARAHLLPHFHFFKRDFIKQLRKYFFKTRSSNKDSSISGANSRRSKRLTRSTLFLFFHALFSETITFLITGNVLISIVQLVLPVGPHIEYFFYEAALAEVSPLIGFYDPWTTSNAAFIRLADKTFLDKAQKVAKNFFLPSIFCWRSSRFEKIISTLNLF